MADESMESILPADALVLLVALPSPHHRLSQEEEPEQQIDEFGPRTSDLDEQILEQQAPGLVLILYRLASSGEYEMQAILLRLLEEEAYRDGGFGAVPASAAAVAGLEKQAFRATGAGGDGGVTGCAICLEDLEDGEEVSAMPCGRGHEFHTECISKWLLCRHALPTNQ
ncbi:hypothetical protein ACP70R_034906 [Stipagrostis hirtigluma subsp. patula]